MSVPRIELADRSTPVEPDGWRELAACRGHGDLFFPTEGSADVARIRAMCAGCPELAEIARRFIDGELVEVVAVGDE